MRKGVVMSKFEKYENGYDVTMKTLEQYWIENGIGPREILKENQLVSLGSKKLKKEDAIEKFNKKMGLNFKEDEEKEINKAAGGINALIKERLLKDFEIKYRKDLEEAILVMGKEIIKEIEELKDSILEEYSNDFLQKLTDTGNKGISKEMIQGRDLKTSPNDLFSFLKEITKSPDLSPVVNVSQEHFTNFKKSFIGEM